MDSITQAALGATLAGTVAGKTLGRPVLLIGAVLGTLPDLDVVI
ncbi:MAG: metal-dependent hydrolase, partial [Marinobacter sp.]|nr:metal-dependent hydrolase [Marinobacter sp.]